MTTLEDLHDVLPAETLAAWEAVATAAPSDGILMGGTALAVHLRHRRSRDLDIFTSEVFDPRAIESALRAQGAFATTLIGSGTLNGVFEGARVQFLHAGGQTVLAPPTRVSDMNVGSLEDIFATKVKVVGDRAELRDYFDLMEIELRANRFVEEGLQLYSKRFAVPANHVSFTHILRGFGYFDDLLDDPYLEEHHGPDLMARVVGYWRRRQPEIVKRFEPYSTPSAQAGDDP